MRSILFVLVVMVAVASTFIGILLIADPGGSQFKLSKDFLQASGLNNSLIAGIVLIGTVGATNMLAVFYHIDKNVNRYKAAIAGAIVLLSVTLLSVLVCNSVDYLHMVFFFLSLIIILLAQQLRGKWLV